MWPTIELAGLHLATYTLMWGLAMFAAGTLAFWRLLWRGFPLSLASGLVLLSIGGGLLAQLVWSAFLSLRQAAQPGQPFALRLGMNIFAFILGIMLAGLVYRRRHPLPLAPLLDATALALPLGEAIGRLGCFGAGCCFGRMTDPHSWLALYLPDPTGLWATRYPTQLLSSFGALVVCLLVLGFELWRNRAHGPAHTQVGARRALPRHILPQRALPQHISPQHALPQHISPQHALPQHISPQRALPQHISPQHISPQRALPQHILPQHISPRHILPPSDWPFAGFLGLLTLFLFGVQRIIVESFRADPPLLGPLHLGHILSALICLAASFGIVRRLIVAKHAAKTH